MTISIHALTVETVVPVLTTLKTLLSKGEAHAIAKGQDPDALVAAQLAPDMKPLSFQVQTACDLAKFGVKRLANVDAPKFEDNEKTFADLQARIDATLAYVNSVPAASFEGAENREIVVSLRDPMELHATGLQYLRDWLLPNFYFHVVTAYDIMRSQGVEIGKTDYLAHSGHYIRAK